MARIMIQGADVTEHVAAMFDAIVGSLDWGSGFLDVETIESILIVGQLAGFDVANAKLDPAQAPGIDAVPSLPRPYTQEQMANHQRARTDVAERWRAQIEAKARALAAGDA